MKLNKSNKPVRFKTDVFVSELINLVEYAELLNISPNQISAVDFNHILILNILQLKKSGTSYETLEVLKSLVNYLPEMISTPLGSLNKDNIIKLVDNITIIDNSDDANELSSL